MIPSTHELKVLTNILVSHGMLPFFESILVIFSHSNLIIIEAKCYTRHCLTDSVGCAWNMLIIRRLITMVITGQIEMVGSVVF